MIEQGGFSLDDGTGLRVVNARFLIRYPSFAIVFGKSNCGKSSIIDTLMTSMFSKVNTVDKRGFTTSQLRGLQQGYKRFPVVFDDIGRNAFRRHVLDIIKDELPPPVAEYPGFVLSMNSNDPAPFPDNWLDLSSSVLSGIIADATGAPAPQWCQKTTWLNYAAKRYDRVKARLNDLLRPAAMVKNEGDAPNGWTLDDDRVIVWEQRDAFGRRGFDWEDVPSTLIDEDASSGGRTVLYRSSLEDFLGRNLRPPRRWRLPWV